ncbi:PREDICTED: uncharacterized protein LOC108763798 [Trachymyrmex cornetzi]|uniref:uncharacterized protein LOC108763798 n=1 Tax=Trachymyrmex cornetzi TaxID=471704 RepID=UPI00084F700C|nr:PREDICTED: uncharacterized protein LOC108763798 [Trachymyrmex cornetzi]XP_018367179.1 PREDICTED: uncharacterized protein LOC108763798 [Trachymyrmex cornetzi]
MKEKTFVKSIMPTYTELLEYAQRSEQIKNRHNLTNEIDTEDINETNTTIFYRNENMDENTSTELTLVKERNEKEVLLMEKNELLQEKQTLLEENEKFKQQVELLTKTVQEQSDIITQMTEDNKKDAKVPVHVLQKVFTAGQIELLMSSKNTPLLYTIIT